MNISSGTSVIFGTLGRALMSVGTEGLSAVEASASKAATVVRSSSSILRTPLVVGYAVSDSKVDGDSDATADVSCSSAAETEIEAVVRVAGDTVVLMFRYSSSVVSMCVVANSGISVPSAVK